MSLLSRCRTLLSKPHLGLIALISVIVPRRLRVDWRNRCFQTFEPATAGHDARWAFGGDRRARKAALVEIQYDTKVGYASYVYLLLIGAGIIRPGRPTKPVAPR